MSTSKGSFKLLLVLILARSSTVAGFPSTCTCTWSYLPPRNCFLRWTGAKTSLASHSRCCSCVVGHSFERTAIRGASPSINMSPVGSHIDPQVSPQKRHTKTGPAPLYCCCWEVLWGDARRFHTPVARPVVSDLTTGSVSFLKNTTSRISQGRRNRSACRCRLRLLS